MTCDNWDVAIPNGMSSQEVLRIVEWIDSHAVCYQINGGWAVDALVGRQTRSHGDLDLFMDAEAVPHLLSWLRAGGYVEEVNELPARTQLRRGQLRVDVHPMTLDAEKNGAQRNASGKIIYRHPENARTTGCIDGRQVCVATAARLRELRDGYRLRDEDLHDLGLLEKL